MTIEGCPTGGPARTLAGDAGQPGAPHRPSVSDRSAAASSTILRAEFADENRWRDVLYVGVNFPLVVIEFTVDRTRLVVLAVAPDDARSGTTRSRARACRPGSAGSPGTTPPTVLIRTLRRPGRCCPVAASLSQLVMALHRAVVAGLLCTSESRELRRQVETLKESRSAILDVEASELHRIERDLHDGAQQRLVMLTIDLGLASERIDSDPEAAKRWSSTARSRRARPWPSCATSFAGSPRRSCSIAGSCRRSARSPAAGPCRPSSE